MTLSDIPIGGIIVAVIGASISLLSLIISKEQKVSEFRQAWIDCLRNDIALLMSYFRSLNSADAAYFTQPGEQWKLQRDDIRLMVDAHTRIRLRLNDRERRSKYLLNSLLSLRTDVLTKRMDITELEANIDDVVEQSNVVLKAEWERVKRGEFVYRFSRGSFFGILLSLLVVLVMTLVRF